MLHALLTALHGMTQGRQSRIGLFHGLGKDGLTGYLRRVRMYEIGAATTYHDAV